MNKLGIQLVIRKYVTKCYRIREKKPNFPKKNYKRVDLIAVLSNDEWFVEFNFLLQFINFLMHFMEEENVVVVHTFLERIDHHDEIDRWLRRR